MYKIGVDIGGTKINIGLFHSDKRILIDSKHTLVSEIGNLPQYIREKISFICDNNGVSISDISSCGIGIPGTVSKDGKRILKVPNIEILTENIAQEIEKEISIPVTLIQDSRAAAWGEYFCGAGQGYASVICITLGTGIGTGIVLNGEIYSGALGCAGELGHIPVVENGRECGCGKKGCLEKYAAGKGLDMTASELLGQGKTAIDLFEAVRKGNVEAENAVHDAIKMLGTAMVSIVNLLSPDCILFSGGLSEQEELYLNPVIEFIKNHCYAADKIPEMKKAAFGENSPLVGAAFFPVEHKRRKAVLSASIMCADVLNMGKALKEIEAAGIEYIHSDIMDNHFVPNMMLSMDYLNKLRPATSLPFDFHIMAQNPENIVEKLHLQENDIVSVHYESTVHLQRVITQIKQKGAKAAVAINPSTPIGVLEEILPEIDMVLIMSVNPGFAGQNIVPTSFEKIRKLKRLLKEMKLENILIEVDGNCSFENVPKMYDAGADAFVVGTSSVFKSDLTIKTATEKLLSLLS